MRVRAAILLVVVLLGACAGDDPGSPAATPTADSGERYESLADVVDALDCKGFQDVGTGDNPGLEAFGICYVGRANVDIYLTSHRPAWEHLADLFPSVLGPNWVIVSPSGIRGARAVQERLGGELVIPPTPTPTQSEAPAP